MSERKPKKTFQPKPRAEQKYLGPDLAPKIVPEIRDRAIALLEKRAEKKKAGEAEKEAIDLLLFAMNEHRIRSYLDDEIHVVIRSTDKTTVERLSVASQNQEVTRV